MPSVGVEFVLLGTNVTMANSWVTATNQGEVFYDTWLSRTGMGIHNFTGFARSSKGDETVKMYEICTKYNLHGHIRQIEQGNGIPAQWACPR